MKRLRSFRSSADAARLLQAVGAELPPQEVVTYLNPDYYRFTQTLTLLPPPAEGEEFLDIGVGRGVLLRGAIEMGYQPVGVDFYEHRLLQDRYTLWNVPLYRCDVSREPLPFADERFRVVAFCELLEHIPSSPAYPLRELLRVTRRGGRLILTTPNCANLRKRLALLAGRSNYCPIDVFFERDVYERHNREYTLREVCWVLERTGWQVEGAEWWSTHLWPSPQLFSLDGHEVRGFRRTLDWFSLRAAAVLPYAMVTACVPSLRELIAVVAVRPR